MSVTRPFPRFFSLARAALVGAFVALMAIAPSARASDVSADKVPPNYSALMKKKAMDVMHAMDPDNKGYVNKDDFMKYFEMMFDKMDKNHDGKLDKSEFMGSKTHEGPG